MFVTLYFLYALTCIGCQPHAVGHGYHTYADCMKHRPTRFSFCVRNPDIWIDT